MLTTENANRTHPMFWFILIQVSSRKDPVVQSCEEEEQTKAMKCNNIFLAYQYILVHGLALLILTLWICFAHFFDQVCSCRIKVHVS